MTPAIEAQFQRFGPAYRWYAVITVMMGTISMVLTTTIINVAMPDIQGAFGMSQDQVQWLSTGFLAAMTATMLANAWAMGAFGQRGTYMGALVIFILASLLGGMSTHSVLLIIARVLQGAMAGIIQPLAMVTIFQVFPPEQRGRGMGVYGIGVVLAPALGPALGGILMEHFDWRMVFYLALPFCVIGLFLGPIFMVGKEREVTNPSFDWLGFGLLLIFLGSTLGGLSNGQRWGWDDPGVVLMLMLGVGALIGFIVWELHHDAPLQDLRIFANPGFGSASLVAFVLGAGIYGSTFLVPLLVQNINGYSPADAGLVLMPSGLILGIVFPLAGLVTDKVRPHWPIITGLLFFALSSWLLAGATVHTTFVLLAWWIMLGRVGLGLIMPALNAGGVRCLPVQLMAQGSGGVNFARQLGGAFGVNLLSIVLDRRTVYHSHELALTQTPDNHLTLDLLEQISGLMAKAGVSDGERMLGSMNYLGRVVFQQAKTLGFQDGFMVSAAVFLVALVPAWILGNYRKLS